MTDIQQLFEVERIKKLKYKYMRNLDCHQWPELADCFAEDAVSDYDSGKYSFNGRDNIIDFLKKFMDRPTIITQHHAHHPEIELTSETTAKAIWYLQDIVINLDDNTTLRGAGFYYDEYEKIEGQWKIKRTGYTRTYEEKENRSDQVKMNKNMFSGE